ncbi:tetratricopeptide repeat protein, partial [Tabrizicola sp.]|uniref:tetratricopeptide repeat protein n=1 Tax=Tabrizicola sp. TaxID=2005166 RepID=UPI003F2D980C
GLVVGEAVTFQNEDTSYRVALGYRDGIEPAPNAWHKTGTIDVIRKDETIEDLTCVTDTIRRVPDRVMERMRSLGRETTSDGKPFVWRDEGVPPPASEAPPCERDWNVDTCWGRGVDYEKLGDLAGALAHYDMSCDAEFQAGGCYNAGKIYLHDRELRDYDRAYDRLSRSCDNNEIGEGPYACKYLGWMHQTGIGAEKDADKAWQLLRRACFPQDDGEMVLIVDSEGCHFLAKAAQTLYPVSVVPNQTGAYVAFLALAMGCAEGAEGICEEAKAFLASETAASGLWIEECGSYGATCASLIEPRSDYEAQTALMEQIFVQFIDALGYLP